MKFLISLLFLTSLNANANAKTNTHFVKTTFEAESLQVETLEDGDILMLELPYTRNSLPSIEVTQEYLMVTPCQVLGPNIKGNKVQFKIIMGEMGVDDGLNGCEVTISRNAPEDEDGSGQLLVFFGFSIDD